MNEVVLSPQGHARRDQILELALCQVRRRRRRRKALRVGVLCVALAGIGVAAFRTSHSPLDHPESPPIAKVSIPRATLPIDRASPKKIVIECVQTDPTIVRRLAAPRVAPKWELIDDDQLLQELAKAGKPAGLARIDGQAMLLFHERGR